jgi:hypothetical protein
VSTHSHDEPFAELREKWGKPPKAHNQAPNNYEEAREEALDRYADERRPE